MHSHIHKYILIQPAEPIQRYTYIYVLRDDHLLLDNGLWTNLWGKLILSHQSLVVAGSSSRVGLGEVLPIHIGMSAAFAFVHVSFRQLYCHVLMGAHVLVL